MVTVTWVLLVLVASIGLVVYSLLPMCNTNHTGHDVNPALSPSLLGIG